MATSNFINVTGAMLASLVFFVSIMAHAVRRSRAAGAARTAHNGELNSIEGVLSEDPIEENHRPSVIKIGDKQIKASEEGEEEKPHVIRVSANDLLDLGKGLKKGDEVVETKYKIGNVRLHQVRSKASRKCPFMTSGPCQKCCFSPSRF